MLQTLVVFFLNVFSDDSYIAGLPVKTFFLD